MSTIAAWARFYVDKKLWVYPYNLEENGWLYWKNLKSDDAYNQVALLWDWTSSMGIKLVVGKKGVRVIEVHNRTVLAKALTLLGLPKDYPWITYSTARYGIIVDTPNVSQRVKGMGNRGYKNLTVIWEGYYVLPCVNIPRYFYSNRIPDGHPIQVSDDVFMDCIDILESR